MLNQTVKLLDLDIAVACPEEVIEALEENVLSGAGGYVCVINVHTLTLGRMHRSFHQVLSRSLLNVPDGMPLVWMGRFKGSKCLRVAGPDLMELWLNKPHRAGVRHFLLGATTEVLDSIVHKLEYTSHSSTLVGTWSPPFGDISYDMITESVDRISRTGANVVWVGLGAPKQEAFMNLISERLPGVVFLGVGAAFDFLAGTKKRAPRFMRYLGFEWFWRLLSEPRRLFRRYLVTNTRFVWYAFVDIFTFYTGKLGRSEE